MSVPGAEEKYLTESWDAAPFCSTKQKKKFQQNGAAYSRELPAINRKRPFRVKRVSSQPEITSFIWSFKSIWISLLQTGAWAIRPSFKTQNITVINCWSFSSFAFSPLNEFYGRESEDEIYYNAMWCDANGWDGMGCNIFMIDHMQCWFQSIDRKALFEILTWRVQLKRSTNLLDNFYPFCLF
jgi:hypothetical protein